MKNDAHPNLQKSKVPRLGDLGGFSFTGFSGFFILFFLISGFASLASPAQKEVQLLSTPKPGNSSVLQAETAISGQKLKFLRIGSNRDSANTIMAATTAPMAKNSNLPTKKECTNIRFPCQNHGKAGRFSSSLKVR
jgi:hypothetical protein